MRIRWAAVISRARRIRYATLRPHFAAPPPRYVYLIRRHCRRHLIAACFIAITLPRHSAPGRRFPGSGGVAPGLGRRAFALILLFRALALRQLH